MFLLNSVQLQCPCANLMICSLKFRKDLLSLKCCSGFCAFGFEAMSHPSCYLTSIIEKTHHGPVIVLFFVQIQQLFQLRRRYPCNQSFLTEVPIFQLFSKLYNTEGAFMILFLFGSDLLNFWKPWHRDDNNKKWLKHCQSHFH